MEEITKNKIIIVKPAVNKKGTSDSKGTTIPP